MEENVKIVVTVPNENADVVRQAIGEAGGGEQGNYSYCSYSAAGIGRFKPEEGADPTIGTIGQHETVMELRIEVTCQKSKAKQVVAAIREVHPYEEPAIDIYPLLNLGD